MPMQHQYCPSTQGDGRRFSCPRHTRQRPSSCLCRVRQKSTICCVALCGTPSWSTGGHQRAATIAFTAGSTGDQGRAWRQQSLLGISRQMGWAARIGSAPGSTAAPWRMCCQGLPTIRVRMRASSVGIARPRFLQQIPSKTVSSGQHSTAHSMATSRPLILQPPLAGTGLCQACALEELLAGVLSHKEDAPQHEIHQPHAMRGEAVGKGPAPHRQAGRRVGRAMACVSQHQDPCFKHSHAGAAAGAAVLAAVAARAPTRRVPRA